MKHICSAHCGDLCEWSGCDFSSANSRVANTAALFYSLLESGVSHDFWKDDSGEEISKRWGCVEKINHLHDSWLALRNDFAKFSTRQGLWFPVNCWNDRCFDFENLCVCTILLPVTVKAIELIKSSLKKHILVYSVNLAFGPKPGFKNNCRALAGFSVQNETCLHLCFGGHVRLFKGILKVLGGH